MAGPPGYLDLRAASQASSRPPLRSPRQHIAGEAPPELSPLDAFALQSRLLAKELEESKNPKSGRRVSRLPPLNDTSPLIVQARRDYFRSISHDSASTDPSNADEEFNDGIGRKTEVEDAFGENRPVSMHPRMSGVPTPGFGDIPVPVPELPRNLSTVEEPARVDDKTQEGANDDDIVQGLAKDDDSIDGFGARRMESPSPIDDAAPLQAAAVSTDDVVHTSPHKDTSGPLPYVQTENPFGIPSPVGLASEGETFDSLGLAPPRAPFQMRPSSAMSTPLETTDEEGTSPMTNSLHSLPPRKLSNGSAISGLHHSPGMPHTARSPSIGSEASAALPRPAFNFSRPLSRAGTPGLELTFSKSSLESHSPLSQTEELSSTPRSINSEFLDGNDDAKAPAPSYIYSKFSLPRGKAVRRSVQPLDGYLQNQWDQPNSQTMLRGAPPSPPVRPSSPSSRDLTTDFSARGPALDQNSTVGPAPQPSPNPSRPSTDGGLASDDPAPRGRAMTSPVHDARAKTAMSISTDDSASTIKQSKSLHITPSSISDMTAEEHLAKGIECHESGALSKSTYHLRHAAKQNNPTGMLLYALACRHGWGMRVNEKEGVEWLRKAAEFASLEIADDEDQMKEGRHVDVLQRKTRKAQFALSIYELGVSHMNGWGIEQDKTLALRCFEIAGSWGDVDALAESGFCYAQGIGCKKDLKKAAKFYREAEAKGMSMVGNSWINKAKYKDDDENSPEADLKVKKTRNKSRTRTLFGRKPNP
ncbi:related to DSF2 Deletion Suppressor of mptFive/pufFive mutation [Cephalotrichum gorgonifer]|uniref:Related to DSF2 Deletion Suppressor of mptFive/pufFive mutation n=1 Tax=Cephalotrichum gorgonifer TaxID=2041049 RepID=A0AAE8SQV4_9PEZI|nr:related to DSF2 Deletion Suppressor of mptFive/pufFive mutation [Cephalotrichum gorgonifer]